MTTKTTPSEQSEKQTALPEAPETPEVVAAPLTAYEMSAQLAAQEGPRLACGEPGAGPYSLQSIRLGPDRLEAAIQQGGAPLRSSEAWGCAANRHTLPWGI